MQSSRLCLNRDSCSQAPFKLLLSCGETVSRSESAEIRHERTGLVFRPGLEGVPATQSSICDIDGQKGLLSYRGYPVDVLASHCSFLETTYLLILSLIHI